jgi:hypothetical protein
MTCQQTGCTRKGDLACVVGDTRKVLCIEHQAKYREAMNCGGRKIVVHHGVTLEDWTPLRPPMAPVEDVPDLGLPHGQPDAAPTRRHRLHPFPQQP